MSTLPTRLVLAGLGCFLALPLSLSLAAEPELGRLFFTQEQRASLDRQRQRGQPASAPFAAEALRLDGFVLRSDGHRTFWVNGSILPPGGQLRLKADSRHPGRASLDLGSGATPVRVGETWRHASPGPGSAPTLP